MAAIGSYGYAILSIIFAVFFLFTSLSLISIILIFIVILGLQQGQYYTHIYKRKHMFTKYKIKNDNRVNKEIIEEVIKGKNLYRRVYKTQKIGFLSLFIIFNIILLYVLFFSDAPVEVKQVAGFGLAILWIGGFIIWRFIKWVHGDFLDQ